MKQAVITTYLEMNHRTELRPSAYRNSLFHIARAEVPTPELNRFFYTTVGAQWMWHNRLRWDYARWRSYVARPELETWIGYLSGTPAGYFELEFQDEGNVELAYFGLLPSFVGKRLGGALLTEAVGRAWDMGARRVWVHTCSLDHPQALRNYVARGFQVYRVEENIEDLPDGPLEPWPGANVSSERAPE